MICPSCGMHNPPGASFCMACATGLVHAAEAQHDSKDMATTVGSFVGRQQELEELKIALDSTIAGQGRMAMLAGEPGIGKTRTAQELINYAQALGAHVLWGRCYEGTGAPPYWPWIQIIRSHMHSRDAGQLSLEMGTGAADIAEIVPEVREVISDLKPPPTLDPDQARFRLFDSIAAFLKRASTRQLLVLALDDLHWADRPSLMMLEFLAQELQQEKLLVLGTYRDMELSHHHPLTNTLGQLTRQPNFLRVSLRGLNYEAVRRIVSNALGRAPAERSVRELYTRSQGNPLFLTEMARLLLHQRNWSVDDSPLTERDWNVRVPPGVKDVIHRRINRLPEQCGRVLTIAAVIGREFDCELLRMLIKDQPQESLVGVLEAAMVAGVIEELSDTAGRYQFTHVLIQDTLTSELSATRRSQLHGLIGAALEERYGTNTTPYAAELAYHFGEAAAAVGTDRLVRYATLAGEQALAAYAYEDAANYFQQARSLKQGQPDDAETATILFGLGRAQGAAGQVHEAWFNLGLAFDYYFETGYIDQAVAVAEYPLFYVPGLFDVTRMVSQALTLVRRDSPEAGRLLSRYGLLINLETGYHGRAQQALAEASAIAQREGDPVLEIQALSNAADVDWYHLRWQEVTTKSAQAIVLARRANDIHAEVWPHFLAATASIYLGRLEEAAFHASAMLDLAEKVRNRGFLSNALAVNSSIALLKGHWHEAREFSDRGLAVAPEFFWLLCNRAMLEYEVGDFEAGEEYLERLLEIMRRTPPGPVGEYTVVAATISNAAQISGHFSRFDIAKEAAQIVLSSPSVAPVVALDSRIGLAIMAALEKDSQAAKGQYAILISSRGTFIDDATSSLDRVLGLVARAIGLWEGAIAHFEEALTNCRRAGYRPELAWVCHDYADTLLQANGPGVKPDSAHIQKALSLLVDGLAIAQELEMRPLVERTLALLEVARSNASPGGPSTPPGYPDGLTHREVEVLRLIADGKSNRQIAENLVVSVHTVIYHVRNIFSKIGASNRVEAAAYASHQRLTE